MGRGAARPSGDTTAPPPADGRAVPSFTGNEEPPPLVVVLPAFSNGDTVALVAEHTEQAVLATGLSRPICTVLVDTSAATDERTRVAFQNARLWGSRVELTLPGAGWGAAVARGLRHAAQVGAEEVVLADPIAPADLEAPAVESRLASALRRLREQERPGAVCSPLAAPWWQRLLAIHVLRPLCAPSLGLTLVDPQARTLVLSGDAVPDVLSPSWGLMRMGWEHGHGLGLLAAVREAGLDVGQTLPRIPHPEAFARSMNRSPVDRREASALLPTALRLVSVASSVRDPAPVMPWVADLGLAKGQLPPPEVFTAMLTQCSRAAQVVASRPGVAAGWPEPLLNSWHAARALQADIPAIAERLWLTYLARLGPWLRFGASAGGYTVPARHSVVAAARQFLLATGTPVMAEQSAADVRGESIASSLPGTG
ncbi:hypothetical protein [Saccharomonospora marina]|uniref:hypothetical protein n=1 Tax=Saccharomonospora marina TaxID=632569 RepID=UPI0012F99BD0|nr:hypothetical protein [Saccharomonospora marina]